MRVKIMNKLGIKIIVLFVYIVCWLGFSSFHPFYISTTEINFNKATKSVEITCRMFTDNLEDALEKTYNKKIDLLHPKNKKELELLVLQYIQNNLKIKINGTQKTISIIGYEKEEDAVWTYLEIKEDIQPQQIEIENTLLYVFFPQQMNMIHVMIDGASRQSSKLINPDKKLNFKF